MMRGIIERIDTDKKSMVIRKLTFDSCSGCKTGCSHKPSESDALFSAAYIQGFEVGDKVIITISPFKRIIGSVVVFLLPVVALWGGFSLFAYIFSGSEGAGIAGGFGSMLFTIFATVGLYRKGFLDAISGTVRKQTADDMESGACSSTT